jgi:hypothetical protein
VLVRPPKAVRDFAHASTGDIEPIRVGKITA